MFQQNSIKARQNLHMNITIAYRENSVFSNVNNLFFAMTHYNCLETKNASALGRWDCGEMDTICGFCNTKMWIKERSAKSTNNNPQFFLCCENGKVLLPNLPTTPQELEVLLTNKERSVVKFRDQICMYNLVLAFNSLDAKVDESVTGGRGSYSFRIQGELYHKIGSLCPAEG
jgi:hypothetical protein